MSNKMYLRIGNDIVPILENSTVVIFEPDNLSETRDIDAVYSAVEEVVEKHKDEKLFNVEVFENV